MTGDGVYHYRGLDGELHATGNWGDLPEAMDYIILFRPTPPPPPHTDEDHDYLATFPAKLRELMARCRR